VKLVISVDVEEEGLFAGRYPRTPPGVSNVAALRHLEFIPREFGFPLTFLVTYQVSRDPEACRVLAHWRERWGAEVGAHLHPWSTPPYAHLPYPEPVRSKNLPRDLLRKKMVTLLSSLKNNLGVTPTSFRMGRFDLSDQVLSLLPELGFKVDSSMVPLMPHLGGLEQLLWPSDPFPLPGLEPQLWEAPLTLVPVFALAPSLVYRLSRALPRKGGELLLWAFRYLGAAGTQPAWFPLTSMRLAASLHRRRRGRVINLFFHSSELHPGASPQFPTPAAVHRLLHKIRTFLTWLQKTGPVQGFTLSQLHQFPPGEA